MHIQSTEATVLLFAYAVCWLLEKGKVNKKSKTAQIIIPIIKEEIEGWFEREGIKNTAKVILFKRVSDKFQTQEGTRNETLWEIGKTIEHNDWQPESGECGEGKFHACSRPYFCDEFRNIKGDRYVAIEIKKVDLYVWKNAEYPHKIGFRKGKVLYECDRFGKERATSERV